MLLGLNLMHPTYLRGEKRKEENYINVDGRQKSPTQYEDHEGLKPKIWASER